MGGTETFPQKLMKILADSASPGPGPDPSPSAAEVARLPAVEREARREAEERGLDARPGSTGGPRVLETETKTNTTNYKSGD